MNRQQQVISFLIARKLKELGVKQESLWWWIPVDIDSPEWTITPKKSFFQGRFYSAFTVAELGEMLPKGYASHKLGDEWYCLRRVKSRDTNDKTEANARAKMLIYLLENKLIQDPNIEQ